MTFDIPTNQDVIRAQIIKTRQIQIDLLEMNRDEIIVNIKIQKDNLKAFKKTLIPVISKQLGVRK